MTVVTTPSSLENSWAFKVKSDPILAELARSVEPYRAGATAMPAPEQPTKPEEPTNAAPAETE